jgi:hypothetical protein
MAKPQACHAEAADMAAADRKRHAPVKVVMAAKQPDFRR